MTVRHETGYPIRTKSYSRVAQPRRLSLARGGDTHMWDPETIANLQVATRTNDQNAYWAFAKHANEISTRNATFRS